LSKKIQERLEKIDAKMLTIHEAIATVGMEINSVSNMLVTLSKLTRGIIESAQLDERRLSIATLYYSIFMGSLVGVIGNFFASFWFQPLKIETIAGLAVSGLLLLGIFYML